MTNNKLQLPQMTGLLVAGLLLLSSDFVLAQGIGSRGGAEQSTSAMAGRNSKAKKERAAKNKKSEPDFPNSSREEPEFKMSAKLGKKVQSGLDALNEEDYEKSEEIFNDILSQSKAMDSEKGTSYQALGTIAYERDEDSLKAIEYNIKAIELNSLPNNSHFGLMQLNAQLYLQEDQFDNAILWADRWMRETGEEKDTLLIVKGQAYYQLEKYEPAATAIKRAIELSDKPNDSWYAALMACYTESENYAEAISYGEGVLAKDPNNKSIIKQLSNVYIENDQEPKALAVMDRAYSTGLLSTEPELRQLAQLYAYAERVDQGAKVIEDGLAKGVLKENLATYSLLGEVYSQGEDFMKTAAAYNKAAIYAKDGDMKFREAYALMDAEKVVEARAAALEALKKTPFKHEGEAWVILGNAEIELNNKAGAIAAFEKATQFPSTKKNAETWLKNVRRM